MHGSLLASTIRTYSFGFLNPVVTIGRGCRFEKGVRFSATDGGEIFISDRVHLAQDVYVFAYNGRVRINENVFVGRGSTIVACESIEIGRDTMISEYVVIRDQDHKLTPRPVRTAGLASNPIIIGEDVWVGCKASVLRGAVIGDRAVIGAHALVKSQIPAGATAVGLPARADRSIGDSARIR
jgi:acetyltransferase-like isoleucine patch superfamily enzyme